MITLQLDMYQACALGALVYCLGRLMVNKLSFLSKYCIPAPVAAVSYSPLLIWRYTQQEFWNSPLTQHYRVSS